MAEGHDEAAWQHTAHLMAAQLSVFRKKPISPDEVNPYSAMRRRAAAKKDANEEPKLSVRELGKMLGARPAKRKG